MSLKIKTMIVEDEPLAREGLMMFIQDIDFLEVVAVCEDALEGNKVLASTSIDLMFLDIHMPKLSGIDFLKSLKEPPMVIMTTAYPNFALQGYELDVIDYLVKPFPFDRFLKSVNKARDFHALKSNSDTQTTSTPQDYFFVKVDYRFEKIHFQDILYVEGMENYIVIYTSSQKYVTLLRMKSIEETLPADKFIRIHKSYIASIKGIDAIDGNQIVIGDKKLPISRDKKSLILERLIKNQ